MRAKRSHIVDGLILAGLCLLFFWRVFAPSAADRLVFRSGDFSDQFYTFARYAAAQLSSGRLPLWNPYTYAGHPFLADVQSGVFYPPRLVTLLASGGDLPYVALEIEAILHFVLAAVFTYLLARRLTGNRVGGFVAAVSFTFSGYLTSYPMLQLAILESVVWLPLMLLCLDVAGSHLENGQHRPALIWAVAAGATFGISLLAGHPQSGMLIGYAGLAYGLFRFWPAHVRPLGSWRWPAALLAVWAAGGLLASIQLVPSLEFMMLSGRASIGFEEAGRGFLTYDLLQLIYPTLGGAFPALYLGLVPLGLAVLAAGIVRASPVTTLTQRRTIVFFAVAAIAGLLLSFGKTLGLYQVAYLAVPGWRLFRGQERTILWTVFSVALLAGYGAAWLAQQWRAGTAVSAPAAGRGLARGYAIAAGLALVLAAAFFIVYQAGRDAAWGFTAASLYTALILALAALAIRVRHPVILVVVLLLDLFSINVTRGLKPPDTLDLAPLDTVLAPALADESAFRIVNESVLPGNFGVLYRLEDTGGSSPLQLRAYARLLDRLPQALAWRLLNVKYVVSWREALDVPAERVGEELDGLDGKAVYLYRLDAAGPRAWLVGQAAVEPDLERTFDLLAAPGFDPARQVVLERAAPNVNGADAGECGSVSSQTRTAEQLVLRVDTERPCVLVMSELDYPGWAATVGGAPADVLRANGILRAVQVPAGQHEVVLNFHPSSVTWGAVLSGLIGLAMIAVLGWLVFSKVPERP